MQVKYTDAKTGGAKLLRARQSCSHIWKDFVNTGFLWLKGRANPKRAVQWGDKGFLPRVLTQPQELLRPDCGRHPVSSHQYLQKDQGQGGRIYTQNSKATIRRFYYGDREFTCKPLLLTQVELLKARRRLPRAGWMVIKNAAEGKRWKL